MNITEKSVDRHYGFGGLMQKIAHGLQLAGKDLHSLSIDDLAPVDEFHTRGRESTVELASVGGLKSTDRVLDVGCGIGGSARFLAKTYRCCVTGVDLTQEYIDVAKELTRLVGLESDLEFHQGSALGLPFDDSSYDVVWTEHAQMNIADKEKFYGEISRVLKPGGKLLFHDIFGGIGSPTFPLPWAEDSSISSLATENQARTMMQAAGLSITNWHKKVEQSIEFFQKVLSRIQNDGVPPIGVHLLMGNTARQKLTNYVQGLGDGQITVGLGMCEKP